MSVRILRIIARLNIGGPARNAMLLTEGLSQGAERRAPSDNNIGYETILVCGEVANGEGDMMYLAREKGINPIIVKELSRDLSPANDFRAFWKIYRIICREKPDVIHTHTAKAGTLGRLAGILYSFRSNGKVRLVHTFHGHVLHSYFKKIKTLFFIWIERILALFTHRIITVSGSLKKEIVGRFKIAPLEKISVVELGFELDELLKLPLREESDSINIGIVGRLTPVKNHRMFFRIASRFKFRAPGIKCQLSGRKVKFVVVGDGELRQELEDCVKQLGIENIVEFKGWVRDLCEIYEGLDIVVLTSLNEGTPVSIIEAMATARPVVATKVGGVSDIVQDGKNGYLVTANDDEGFIERLLDLVENTDRRMTFGRYGRELVRKRFSKERLIKDMEELYNNLLRNR